MTDTKTTKDFHFYVTTACDLVLMTTEDAGPYDVGYKTNTIVLSEAEARRLRLFLEDFGY